MTQLSIFDLQKNNEPAPARSQVRSKDLFDCCSRYRECSDAKKCLIANEDYSNACTYRRKLESGIRFFGKKAPDFDMTKYRAILQKYKRLTEPARELFNQLAVHFYDFGGELLLCRTSELGLACSVGILSYSTPKKNKIIEQASRRILRFFLTNNVYEELRTKYCGVTEGKKAIVPKKIMAEYLKRTDNADFDKYTQNFAVVYVGIDEHKYLVELYRDVLKDCRDMIPPIKEVEI